MLLPGKYIRRTRLIQVTEQDNWDIYRKFLKELLMSLGVKHDTVKTE